MKQILNKLVKQKTKINRDTGKIYNNVETNEEEINKINEEVELLRELFLKEKRKTKIMTTFC